MIRVKITLSYDGTSYHGWQVQPNADTVQGRILSVLKELFGEEIPVCGCSRTDAGVHAENFVCHADLPRPFPLDKLPFAMNALLPRDIAVKGAEAADSEFHARFSCKGKMYVYRLHNARIRDPFELHRAGFWPTELDVDEMDRIAKAFVGQHDFAAFMATGSVIEDTVRTIYSFDVVRHGDLITFTVCGNGFLYNMVRIMVGTLIYGGAGKLEHSIEHILQSRDRTLAGITVPPQGLYLKTPFYSQID